MRLVKVRLWLAGAVSLFVLIAMVTMVALSNFGSTVKSAQAQITSPGATAAPAANFPRQISVNAVGKVQAAPDVAYLSVGAIVQAPTAREALDKASTSAGEIRKALVEAGIPDQDIQTQGINAYPVQAPGKEGLPPTEPTSYRANVNFTITINDLSKAGTALDAATKAGANEIGGVNYAIKDDSTLRAQALEQAVKQARPKAEAIARGLGLQLGQVVTVIESPNYYGGGPANSVPVGKGGDSLAPGQLTVGVSVTISYAIL
jgi:hypothetical protein